MKAKLSVYILALTVLLALGFAACSRGRDDAQIAGEVQQKIFSDASIQSRQITVQAANGVVTLSGNVANDNERTAAAAQAAQVAGVKTVVNNLQVAAPAEQAAQEPAPMPETKAEPSPEPAPRHRASEPAPRPRRRAERTRQTAEDTTTVASAPKTDNPAPLTPPADTRSVPPTPPPPRKVTLPEGTVFSVRLIDPIDSATNQAGDTFRATLDSPITVDGDVVVPASADVQGRVVESKSAGHYAGKPELALELVSLKVNNNTYSLHTNQYTRQGTSRGAQTAKRVGVGAAIGAIIGGIAGGGKGAAIGTAAGAGVGGGVQTATKAQQIKLAPEALLSFQLQSPVTVVAASQRNNNRPKLEE